MANSFFEDELCCKHLAYIDLCPGILTALCKKEGQLELSLLILLLSPWDSFTADSLFCPSFILAHMDTHSLLDALLGSGDTKVGHVSLAQGAQDVVWHTSEQTSTVQCDFKKITNSYNTFSICQVLHTALDDLLRPFHLILTTQLVAESRLSPRSFWGQSHILYHCIQLLPHGKYKEKKRQKCSLILWGNPGRSPNSACGCLGKPSWGVWCELQYWRTSTARWQGRATWSCAGRTGRAWDIILFVFFSIISTVIV